MAVSFCSVITEFALAVSAFCLCIHTQQPAGQTVRESSNQGAREPGIQQPGSQAARQPGSQAARRATPGEESSPLNLP